jgi:hypothetical protein
MMPNTHFNLGYEMDIMCVRKGSLYVEEIEIKTSRSDFLADFKKTARHGILKHTLLKQGQLVANYFSFLVPALLLPKIQDDIPEYAGIYVGYKLNKPYHENDNAGYIRQVRRPKRLHKNRPTEKLLYKKTRGMTFRYWDLLHERQKARS